MMIPTRCQQCGTYGHSAYDVLLDASLCSPECRAALEAEWVVVNRDIMAHPPGWVPATGWPGTRFAPKSLGIAL